MADPHSIDWELRLGFLIHDVSRLRRSAFDRCLKPLNVTRSQWWVLAYLSAEARASLASTAAAASAHRDVAWITLEYAGVPPWLPAPPPAPPDEPGASNLLSLATWRDGAVATRTLGWVHPHGAWLAWMDPT